MVPETCPNCGAEVPSNARACPDCGADEQTGWAESATLQRLGLSHPEFDYEEFVSRDIGGTPNRQRPMSRLWCLAALGLVLILFLLWLRG
jgi:RNA polymerase subunit RPABC4/transcription elongation factor Spt4